MSRGFLFAQSLRLIIVCTTLQMNLAQFPVFHLRSIKHPQPNKDIIIRQRYNRRHLTASCIKAVFRDIAAELRLYKHTEHLVFVLLCKSTERTIRIWEARLKAMLPRKNRGFLL